MNRHRSASLGLGLTLLSGLLFAQGLEYVQSHYTKYEYRISMRDGVKLFTAVYVPKDESQKCPILLTRTPYSVAPYGVDHYRETLGPWEKFAKEGYIFVYQDVRGRFLSEGEFVHVRPYRSATGPKDIDESTDTYDTIDWLVKHVPNNNGQVGIWGISYPGFYSATGMIDAHPALKAASPQAPVGDWFIGDDFHHNGAFFLAHAFNWMVNNDRVRPEPTTKSESRYEYGTPNGYDFFLRLGAVGTAREKYLKHDVPFWEEMVRHPNYDEFWKARRIIDHVKNIKPAVLNVGGWFDAEDLYGPLHIYEAAEKSSPGAVNMIVMGPWYHGGWARSDGDALGQVRFGSKTAVFFRENIEFPFFEHFLKQKGEHKLPEAYMFETGTNQWRAFEAWPPKEARPVSLYFRAGGKLAFEAPQEAEGFDEYTSDPARPVPFIGYTAIGMTREYMVDDQRFAATRPDVLVYETEPLEQDFTIAGPITASLRVSTTGTDSDWIVKLIDVYPADYPDPDPNPANIRMGTYQQLIRGEPMRGRFRNSFVTPEPFRPGEITKVEFVMPDVCHTFRRGHKMMVQVQSTWFPLVDRNPQKFVDIYNAKESDFQKAQQRVYRSRDQQSFLKVNVLGRD